MAEEVEKKYRLSKEHGVEILEKLENAGAQFVGEDFEENILYRGGILSLKPCVLRLRRTQNKTVLTYKESRPSTTSVKRRLERETKIENADEMHAILENLGYVPSLVYEKRRKIYQFETVEVVLDELPFGFYLEIEGEEDAILAAEKQLGIEDLPGEPLSYPALTAQSGEKKGESVEARFSTKKD